MQVRRTVVRNLSGLHARPAARFVQAARAFRAAVRIVSDRGMADGKSIVGVLKLGASLGTPVTLEIEGDDEVAAAEALVRLLEAGLGEGVVLYRSVVTQVGPAVPEFQREGLLVFFAEGAPPELHQFSVLHRPAERPLAPLAPGDAVQIGPWTGRITGVGEVADRNLAELGHLVLAQRADGRPQLPGQVSVAGSPLPLPSSGDAVRIVRPAQGPQEGNGTVPPSQAEARGRESPAAPPAADDAAGAER